MCEIGIRGGVNVAESVWKRLRPETLSLDQGNRSGALPPRFPLRCDGADNIKVHEEGKKGLTAQCNF